MKDYSKVKDIKTRVESDYLKLEGVHGISIGEEFNEGKGTGKFAIYLHVHPYMKGLVSLPNEIEQVTVLTKYVDQPKPHVNSSKYRPLQGGCQLEVKAGGNKGHGTLGCLVSDNEDGGKIVALSNQHVIENPGKKVGQPKVCCGDEIGKTIRSKLSANVDGAICSIGDASYEGTVIEIGDVNGEYTVTSNDILNGGYPVKKYGRTTGFTQGNITGISYSGNRTDGWQFSNQLFINSNLGDPGDSGSVIIDDNGNVVGLYWGGTDSAGAGSPIAEVMSELKINILTASNAPALPEKDRLVFNGAELFAQVEQETLKYPLASYLYNLVTLHLGELTHLVNNNKKVATVWHRNNGPMILNKAIKFIQQRNTVISDLIFKQGGRESLVNISNIFQKHGSEELKSAINKIEPYVYSFLEMTYHEILDDLKSQNVPEDCEPQTPQFYGSISPEPCEAVINEESLNYITGKYFLANKSFFDLELIVPLTIAGKDYEYLIELKVKGAPNLEFSAVTTERLSKLGLNKLGLSADKQREIIKQMDFAAPENNLKASIKNSDFAIYDYEGGTKGKLLGSLKIGVNIIASLGVTSNSLHLLPISGEVIAGSDTDPIATLLLQVLLGTVEDRFSDYPLPHFDLFLGFGATIDRAEISAKELKAKIALDHNIRSSGINASQFSEMLETEKGSKVNLSVPESSLNFIGEKAIDLPNFNKTEEASGSGFGARVGVFAGVAQPRINIGSGVATATTELGAKAYVGIQVFGKWLDITLTPGLVTLNLMVQLKAINSSKTIAIKLIPNFDSITIDWGLRLPFPFSLATSAIQAILAKMLVAIIKTFSSEFAGIEIPLYTLEDSNEILNTDFNIKFDSFGFSDKKATAQVSAS